MTRVLTAKGEQKDALADFIPFVPAFRGYLAASVGPSAGATLNLTEQVDTDGAHDDVTNPSRWTCQRAGRYRIVAQMRFVPAAAVQRVSLALAMNGAAFAEDSTLTSGTFSHTVRVVDEVDCAVGDYVQMSFTDSDGNATIAAGQTATYMAVSFIGPGFQSVRAKPVISYVTPAQFAALAPIDGDEVYLIADAAAGLVWHLRYNAVSASAYKWEYLGGSDAVAYVSTQEDVLGGSVYKDLTTAGPSFAVPRAGEYQVYAKATAIGGVGGGTARIKIVVNNVETGYEEGALTGNSYRDSSVLDQPVITVATAGHVIKLRYWSNTTPNGIQYAQRVLRVHPVRIS